VIFPAITETLVIPLDVRTVENRIREGIENKKFNGVVTGRGFSLSARLARPPQFSPIVLGRIESSSRGCLIFVRYELMPATKLLLIFVSVVLILVSVGAVVFGARIFYSFFALALIIVFRSVALTNIRLHRDPVRQNLLDILGDN
jgi:hypothetical protein